MSYTVHTVESAPVASKDILAGAQTSLGFVPNLYAVMSEAPALLKAYVSISKIFEEASFSTTERQVVLLTTSYENNCEYCVAAHSVIAAMQKVTGDIVDAIRTGRPIADPKLEALRKFTEAVVSSRGWPSEAASAAFLDNGYSRQQALEVVLGVGLKTLSNYANHLAETPLDKAFAPATWSKAA